GGGSVGLQIHRWRQGEAPNAVSRKRITWDQVVCFHEFGSTVDKRRLASARGKKTFKMTALPSGINLRNMSENHIKNHQHMGSQDRGLGSRIRDEPNVAAGGSYPGLQGVRRCPDCQEYTWSQADGKQKSRHEKSKNERV